ncbi:hypothetical protein K3495_g3972 [Podosphaera aphanis]|nr:hypothetical protein K3495_g3972 [Podosphaera aphanis]
MRMDLPKLREKPDFDVLLNALNRLEANETNPRDTYNVDEDSDDVLERHEYEKSFPLSVIQSPLDWLASEEVDLLYTVASKRIAERCGRVAMPEITRTWTIPADRFHPTLEFLLREPPLTGDNLGLKTWATSFVISQKLGVLGHDYLSHLVHQNVLPNSLDRHSSQNACNTSTSTSSKRVLELGSGTGLVGIAAAATWGVSVLCTDLEPIQENLAYNIQANQDTVARCPGGSVSCQTLDWRCPEKAYPELQSFEIILAADPLYDDFHPFALANTIHTFLKQDARARVVVAIPFRDKHTVRLSDEFTRHMISRQFVTVGSTANVCVDDDWETNADVEEVMIQCTIWRQYEEGWSEPQITDYVASYYQNQRHIKPASIRYVLKSRRPSPGVPMAPSMMQSPSIENQLLFEQASSISNTSTFNFAPIDGDSALNQPLQLKSNQSLGLNLPLDPIIPGFSEQELGNFLDDCPPKDNLGHSETVNTSGNQFSYLVGSNGALQDKALLENPYLLSTWDNQDYVDNPCPKATPTSGNRFGGVRGAPVAESSMNLGSVGFLLDPLSDARLYEDDPQMQQHVASIHQGTPFAPYLECRAPEMTINLESPEFYEPFILPVNMSNWAVDSLGESFISLQKNDPTGRVTINIVNPKFHSGFTFSDRLVPLEDCQELDDILKESAQFDSGASSLT